MKKANIGLALLLALVTLAGCDQQGVTSAGSSSESSTGTSSSAGDSGSSSTPVVETHSILIGETGGATVTPSKESAEAGERITLTIVCPDGKEVDKVTLSVAGVEVTANPDGTYSFLMPAGDVTVTVTLKDEVLSSYVLTIDNKAGVEIVDLMDKGWNTIPANPDGTYDLKPNETYTLLIKPGSGTGAYRVRIGDTVIQANEGSYSFTMPASDATITIETIPSYKVTLDYDADAISEVYLMDSAAMTELNASSIIEGMNVYVSPSANPGYAVTGILLDGEALELEGTSAFFTMPAKDVTITIETEGQAPAGHAIEIQEPDGISISIGSEIVENETYLGTTMRELVPYPFDQTTWEAGETIYVQAEVMGSYTKILTLEKVTWNGNEIALDEDGFGSFVMPEEGVVLTAETEWIYYNLSFDGGDTGITATFANEEGTTAVAHQGETITVTLDVPEGVTVDQVLVNDTPAEDKHIGWTESEEEPYVYTFTMPYQDIAISVEASVPTTGHALSYKIEGTTDPTLSATFYNESQEEITTAKAGETVYIMVSNAPLNHKLVGVYLGDTALGTTLVDGWTRYVIEEMPDEDVEIRIVYAEAVTVTINLGADAPEGAACVVQNSSWQTIEGTSFQAVPGETYYLDIYADNIWPDKVFANGVEVPLDDNTGKYKLTVPSENVAITVEWPQAADTYTITYQPSENDPADLSYYIYVNWVSTTQAEEGDEIMFGITGGIISGSEVSRVLVNGTEATHEYGATWSFIMPAEDVVITIEWASSAETGHAVTHVVDPAEAAGAVTLTYYDGYKGLTNPIDPSSVEEGVWVNVLVQVDPESGYELESVTKDGSALLTSQYLGKTYYTFDMGAEDVEIVVHLTKPAAGGALTFEFQNDNGSGVAYFYKDNGSGAPGYQQFTTAELQSVEPGTVIYIDAYLDVSGWPIPTSVTLNGEPVTETYETSYGTYYVITMPEGDAHLVLSWEEQDPPADTYALTYETAGTESGNADFYTLNPGGWMEQLTLSGLDAVPAGEPIYIDAYEDGTYAAPTSITMNGDPVTETYSDGYTTYYVITMPEENAHLVLTWGESGEPPVTGDSYSLTYVPGEGDPDADVMFFPSSGSDAGQITTASAGDTVLVNVWCETATPTGVLVNGEPATPRADYGAGTWEFEMPEENVTITVLWEEEDDPAQGNLIWVPEENAPEGAEVKFYSDFGETEITSANPGDLVYIGVTGGNVRTNGVQVNGGDVIVAEMTGYYYFEMPAEGTATVTINWLIY